ncbi:MAG: CHASE3 domain-containing protein [Geminicoccaceae bacterium]
MAWYDSPLVRRVVALMAAGILALLAIDAASLWLAARTDRYAAEVASARELRLAAGGLLVATLDMETGQRGYLLTGEGSYLEPYDAAKAELPVRLDRLRSLAAEHPDVQAAIERLATLVADKAAELDETIRQAGAGDQPGALALVRTDRGKSAMDEIRTTVEGLTGGAEQIVADGLESLRSSGRALSWVSAGATLLILLLAAGAVWTVTRYTRELMRARREVEAANAGLEERVAERTAELSRANEEIQRFAYIVSHDLRAPLVNILGFTSELETGVQTLQRYVEGGAAEADLAEQARLAVNEDMPEAVGFIRTSTNKMDRLINAILKLSREGRRALNAERVDLGRLLTAIRDSVQHQLGQAEATLKIASGLPTIVSDRLALEQIFGNLLDNAVKYLAKDRPGVIEIRGATARGRVEIEVADNGRGIPAADHERIFELFRRSGAQDRPGEGIGLAHVRALVRRLGGDITVQSDPGSGSRFIVALPQRIPAWSLGGDAS